MPDITAKRRRGKQTAERGSRRRIRPANVGLSRALRRSQQHRSSPEYTKSFTSCGFASTCALMPHAHSPALQRAAKVLRAIAEDDVSQRRSLDAKNAEDAGGWLYHGKAQGVRIFSKSDDAFPELPRSLPGAVPMADSKLPFFRGEGVIEGEWRIADVLATLVSIGARSHWDERFKSSASRIVALLCRCSLRTDTFCNASASRGRSLGAHYCTSWLSRRRTRFRPSLLHHAADC
jgi:hypothetical protein